MNGYRTNMPRAAFGVAAIALTAITLGLVIVAPAKTESAIPPSPALVATTPDTSAPATAAIVPSRIEVIGVREHELLSSRPQARKAKQG
jgi:hypothetical protein